MSSVTQTPGTTLRLKYRDTAGVDKDLPYPLDTIPNLIRTRNSPKPRILSQDRFHSIGSSWFNDGAGVSFRDTDVLFGENPTMRLDPQETASSQTDPGSNADTTGVIMKRRFNKVTSSKTAIGKYQMEWWMRFTSANSKLSSQYSASIYHRDATNIYGFWLWLDAPNSQLKINNTGSYTSVLASDFGGSSAAAYEPDATTGGTFDRAGHWNYLRLAVNFDTGKYIDCQLDHETVDLSTYSVAQLASSGGNVLHFSHQYASRNTSPRYVNVGDIVISELS